MGKSRRDALHQLATQLRHTSLSVGEVYAKGLPATSEDDLREHLRLRVNADFEEMKKAAMGNFSSAALHGICPVFLPRQAQQNRPCLQAGTSHRKAWMLFLLDQLNVPRH